MSPFQDRINHLLDELILLDSRQADLIKQKSPQLSPTGRHALLEDLQEQLNRQNSLFNDLAANDPQRYQRFTTSHRQLTRKTRTPNN